MRERFFVQSAKSINRRVSIRSRLEIREEVIAVSIAQPHSRDALVDLPDYICPRQTAARAEAAIVTKRASAFGHGAIYIRTREPRIETYLLNAPSETPPQKETARIIWQPGILPCQRVAAGAFSSKWVHNTWRALRRKWFG
jgi:hypothetical protein